MSVPSAGPDWLSSDLVISDGGDEESDWTGRLFPSSSVGREEEGSVRMFLEITGKIEEESFTLLLYHRINQNRLNMSDVTPTSLDEIQLKQQEVMSERLTSCWSVVVVICRRAAAERAETRHDDQTQRDEDDLRTQTVYLTCS